MASATVYNKATEGLIQAALRGALTPVQAQRLANEDPEVLALALLAFAGAEAIGGNGFIAAFTAGLAFGGRLRHKCEFLFEFMETEGQLLVLLIFLIFGATMVPDALAVLDWRILLYAGLSLTVIRMIPVAVCLTGTKLDWRSIAFIGWFGPRGIASVLYLLMVVGAIGVAGNERVLSVIVLTVMISVVAHGVSAVPLSKFYGRSTTFRPS